MAENEDVPRRQIRRRVTHFMGVAGLQHISFADLEVAMYKQRRRA